MKIIIIIIIIRMKKKINAEPFLGYYPNYIVKKKIVLQHGIVCCSRFG